MFWLRRFAKPYYLEVSDSLHLLLACCRETKNVIHSFLQRMPFARRGPSQISTHISRFSTSSRFYKFFSRRVPTRRDTPALHHSAVLRARVLENSCYGILHRRAFTRTVPNLKKGKPKQSHSSVDPFDVSILKL